MFRRVLVPVDFSEKCSVSLDIAANIADHYSGEIDLLHVIETLSDVDFSELRDFYERLERQALKNMQGLVGAYRDLPVPINITIRFGNRSREILVFSEEREAGLIIMNSHVVDLEKPAEGWGTISYKVALLSRCPVMLVK